MVFNPQGSGIIDVNPAGPRLNRPFFARFMV